MIDLLLFAVSSIVVFIKNVNYYDLHWFGVFTCLSVDSFDVRFFSLQLLHSSLLHSHATQYACEAVEHQYVETDSNESEKKRE